MTKIKLCGLTREQDIAAVNELKPDYIGFVFAPKSKRYVNRKRAAELKALLDPGVKAVGVFVKESPQTVAALLRDGILDIAQLHGGESEEYIAGLRMLTDSPIIKAFRVNSEADIAAANGSSADFVLLDSGTGGTGTAFDWELLEGMKRPYFLAGGLDAENVAQVVRLLDPFAVDVSSGIETNGVKDPKKMREFVKQVR